MTTESPNHKDIPDKIPGLTPDDRAFVSDIMSRFIRVELGFRAFTSMPPLQRIPQAVQALGTQPRSGWLRLQPDPFKRVEACHPGETFNLLSDSACALETDIIHIGEAKELYYMIFNSDPDLRWGTEVMQFHDLGEGVIGDFTPHDDISREEKARIEMIAVELLTENRHQGDLLARHARNCIRIFDGLETDYQAMADDMLNEIARQRREGLIKPFQERTVQFFEDLYNTPNVDLKKLRTQCKDIDILQMIPRAIRIVKEGFSDLPLSKHIKSSRNSGIMLRKNCKPRHQEICLKS